MSNRYSHGDQLFLTPGSLAELWKCLNDYPNARLIHGGTDFSLEITKRYARPTLIVSLEAIAELRSFEVQSSGYFIGSGRPLSDVENDTAQTLPPIARMLRYFGARQIKHRATLGGNLCTASPIGDLAPALLSLGAVAHIAAEHGIRKLALDQFFVGYRKTALKPNEILLGIEVPEIPTRARASTYKVSKRRELDISTVSAGFYVELDSNQNVVEARFAFGGMSAIPARATNTELSLKGKNWNEENVKKAMTVLRNEFTPLTDHRGSATYRQVVAANLLLGFFEETQSNSVPNLKPQHASTAQPEVSSLNPYVV